MTTAHLDRFDRVAVWLLLAGVVGVRLLWWLAREVRL